MNCVCEERDTPRKIENNNLYGRGDKQPGERPLDGPDAAIGGEDCWIYCAVGMAVVTASVFMSMIAVRWRLFGVRMWMGVIIFMFVAARVAFMGVVVVGHMSQLSNGAINQVFLGETDGQS